MQQKGKFQTEGDTEKESLTCDWCRSHRSVSRRPVQRVWRHRPERQKRIVPGRLLARIHRRSARRHIRSRCTTVHQSRCADHWC